MNTNRKILIFSLLLLFTSYAPLMSDGGAANPYQSLSQLPQDDTVQNNNYYNGPVPQYYNGSAYPATYSTQPYSNRALPRVNGTHAYDAHRYGEHPQTTQPISKQPHGTYQEAQRERLNNRVNHENAQHAEHRGPVGRR